MVTPRCYIFQYIFTVKNWLMHGGLVFFFQNTTYLISMERKLWSENVLSENSERS